MRHQRQPFSNPRTRPVVAETIVNVRLLVGYTQQKMAEEMILYPGVIAAWETGKKTPCVTSLKRLSAFAKQHELPTSAARFEEFARRREESRGKQP